ncbi:MAG: FAD-dependent oxidoreductase [Microbacteriaceae bacterium]|nr:FAD-dependent oxidoreductase [Microbacteriaceae bacterium]
MTEPVLVVGGGVGGLVVAYDLARQGVPVTVLEADERTGGQLAPVVVGGIAVDAGAESFATRTPAVAELAAELGLETTSPLDSPAWLIGADGGAAPLPAASVLGIPAEPFAADVVALLGTGGAFRAELDKVIPLLRPAKYRSLGQLVRRRMGRKVLDRLVDPVVRGVHSSAADAMPVEAASPGLTAALGRAGSLAAAVADLRASAPAGSQVGGIVGGVHRLAERLVEEVVAHRGEIRAGARVVDAQRNALTLATGERLRGRVVVAAPGIASEPVRTRGIVLAIAAVESAALDEAPRGTGALVASGAPGIRARAFTHSSAKWAWLGEAAGPGRHLVRCSYDGVPEDPERTLLADLRAITGAADIRLTDLAVRSWVRTLAAHAPADDGPLVAGEAASGTGLATIVPRARALAQDVIEHIGGSDRTGTDRGAP